MNAIEAVAKMLNAQTTAQLALGAAIEELAVWVESTGGGQAACNARDALNALDDASDVMNDCMKAINDEIQSAFTPPPGP